MFAHMQTSTNVLQTLDGKQKFERFMRSHGIHVKSYRADNGVFATKDFIHNIKLNDQNITFSSTGAHFQNGVAERAIRLVSEWTRTALLHAGLQWQKVTPDLWPFAVLYAVDIWNHSPSQTNNALLSASSISSSPSLDHFHPFGSPVYILNRSLADGNSIPRWQPRSHLGIYLGRSPNHAKDVSLILDLTTNYISAKYHIIYDNKVETTTNSNNNNKIWTTLFIEQLQSTYSQHLPPPSTVDLQQHPSSPTKPIHPTNNVRNAPPNSSTFRSERLSRPLSPSRLSS